MKTMRHSWRSWRSLAGVLVAGVALAACGLPQGQAPSDSTAVHAPAAPSETGAADDSEAASAGQSSMPGMSSESTPATPSALAVTVGPAQNPVPNALFIDIRQIPSDYTLSGFSWWSAGSPVVTDADSAMGDNQRPTFYISGDHSHIGFLYTDEMAGQTGVLTVRFSDSGGDIADARAIGYTLGQDADAQAQDFTRKHDVNLTVRLGEGGESTATMPFTLLEPDALPFTTYLPQAYTAKPLTQPFPGVEASTTAHGTVQSVEVLAYPAGYTREQAAKALASASDALKGKGWDVQTGVPMRPWALTSALADHGRTTEVFFLLEHGGRYFLLKQHYANAESFGPVVQGLVEQWRWSDGTPLAPSA